MKIRAVMLANTQTQGWYVNFADAAVVICPETQAGNGHHVKKKLLDYDELLADEAVRYIGLQSA